ncbi:MAG TPA: hypothetical protein PLV68_04125, partial [Ilumatobacteraceae bacterium]|nr:hypothetical protein [Ilumatobacteraceae bacterium]
FFAAALLPKGGDLAGQRYPTPFNAKLTIGDLVLGPGDLTILVTVPIVALVLATYLGRSKNGRASRASAENSAAARL